MKMPNSLLLFHLVLLAHVFCCVPFVVFAAAVSGNVPSAAADQAEEELVLVQALWRHGDRAPLGTFKDDPWQEENWPQGWGELTPLGMKQHVILGKKLRRRYIDQLKFIGPEYRNSEIYVRSTDRNRTLISAISNLIGFYGPGTKDGYPSDLSGEEWPGWYLPIAVHTLDHPHDRMAIGEPCRRYDAVHALLKQTPEYRELVEKHQPGLDWLNEKTGMHLDLFSVWQLWDVFNIESLYGMELVEWARNATVREMINEMNTARQQLRSGHGFADLNGTNFAYELGRIQGGDILWTLIDNMQDKLACQTPPSSNGQRRAEMQLRASPIGTPFCGWMNRMRYFVYSAHDSTIVALFAALGFPKTDYDREQYPDYTACITLELWRQTQSGELSVKLLYWRPESDAPIEITHAVTGCANKRIGTQCTLAQFVERSKPYQMLPDRQTFCETSLSPEDKEEPVNGAGGKIMMMASVAVAVAIWAIMALFPFP